MERFDLPPIEFPQELSDEAVTQLLECLYELANYVETLYAAQLYRYAHAVDERQQSLWPDDEPPF